MKSKYQILCESLKKSATEYTIIGFPVKTFVKDVAKVFGSSRIKHVIQSKGFQLLGYSNITIHSFFVPEFLFILKQLPRRFRYKSHYKCNTCGFTCHADLNAAINIRDAYLRTLSITKKSIEQAVVNQPNVSASNKVIVRYKP